MENLQKSTTTTTKYILETETNQKQWDVSLIKFRVLGIIIKYMYIWKASLEIGTTTCIYHANKKKLNNAFFVGLASMARKKKNSCICTFYNFS